MSANQEFIENLVNERKSCMYDAGFEQDPLNYYMAEKQFLSTMGRRLNEVEQEELTAAFAARAVRDKEFVEQTALEACELHRGLIMTGTTLDDGVDNFADAVESDVREALFAKEIMFMYKIETHVPSVTKLRNYIEAAQELEV